MAGGAPHQSTQAHNHLLYAEGFGQVIVRPACGPLTLSDQPSRAVNMSTGKVRPAARQARSTSAPSHFRQAQVQDRHVIGLGQPQMAAVLAIGGNIDGKMFVGENPLPAAPKRGRLPPGAHACRHPDANSQSSPSPPSLTQSERHRSGSIVGGELQCGCPHNRSPHEENAFSGRFALPTASSSLAVAQPPPAAPHPMPPWPHRRPIAGSRCTSTAPARRCSRTRRRSRALGRPRTECPPPPPDGPRGPMPPPPSPPVLISISNAAAMSWMSNAPMTSPCKPARRLPSNF